MKTNITNKILGLAAVLFLAGCAPQQVPLAGPILDNLSGERSREERRLTTAAADAIAAGKSAEALTSYKKLYKRFGSDTNTALNYAQLLRREGQADESIRVLSPLIKEGRDFDPILLNELAAAKISTGALADAENDLKRVMADDRAEDLRADTANLMGIVLDAQGRHKEAEDLFRQSLQAWKGDSTSVMNNLGLNLANQAKFDEALLTLRKALLMAPDRAEIARNVDIVSKLRDSVIPSAPVKISQ